MTEQEFMIERQKAVERMKKMAENSPEFPNKKTDKSKETFDLPFNLEQLNIPFLNRLKNDKDSSLILGLVLLLFCESNDKLLLLALIYILL